jgi:GH24 family phage-related lysozyme (muramidase)
LQTRGKHDDVLDDVALPVVAARMVNSRISIGALALSAAGLVGLITHESYTDRAIIPVKGDRPTVGFGSTFRDDGSPVKMGDTITPPKAIARTLAHIGKDESRLKQCVKAPLHQAEYDLLVDHSYQYGAAATCSSTLVKHVNAGRYADACAAYLSWRYVKKRDCSIRSNGCYGVWLRAQERNAKCMEAQR